MPFLLWEVFPSRWIAGASIFVRRRFKNAWALLRGWGPVAINPRGWEAVDRNPQKNHGWYSDLRTWRKYATEWGDWHPSPITMATSNVVALHVALEQLMQEGIETRLARYRALAMRLRAGLQPFGIPAIYPRRGDDARAYRGVLPRGCLKR